ncbi:uncharacterized protein LOC135114692 isoform X10 [Scylla paramamosain]|uniref:uncharacterized protein LOC135114692 isoform X10 n=1 Tax=Scylla paramamosain TaxID=85552 RepID=UPI003082B018
MNNYHQQIPGISMHKGYAFVQFTNPFDARSACMGEDGRGVFGQILDVNLVAEPKPHQIGRKRPNVAKTSGDCYNAGGAMGACGPRLTPPLKRPRLVVPSMRQQPRAQSPKKVAAPGLEDLKTYRNNHLTSFASHAGGSPDILICGNCRELFSNLSDFIDHRRTYCKLRFTCKCSSHNGILRTEESALLLCALCKENFASAWDLMVHAQAAHMVNIYQLGSKDASQDGSSSIAAEDSAAGNDLTTDATSESNGGEASGEASAGIKEEEEGLSTLPKENGVGGEEEGEGSSEMMNSSPILPQSEMDQGEGERETGMVQ